MHYADHVTKEWDNIIQLTHYLVNWKKKKNMEAIQRHTDKMTGKGKKKTKLQKQMKRIRGTVVTEMKKNNATWQPLPNKKTTLIRAKNSQL